MDINDARIYRNTCTTSRFSKPRHAIDFCDAGRLRRCANVPAVRDATAVDAGRLVGVSVRGRTSTALGGRPRRVRRGRTQLLPFRLTLWWKICHGVAQTTRESLPSAKNSADSEVRLPSSDRSCLKTAVQVPYRPFQHLECHITDGCFSLNRHVGILEESR